MTLEFQVPLTPRAISISIEAPDLRTGVALALSSQRLARLALGEASLPQPILILAPLRRKPPSGLLSR